MPQPTASFTDRMKHHLKEGWILLRTKFFWKNILLMLGAFLLFVLLFGLFLRWFTNHGQQLQLPDYTNVEVNKAIEDADDHEFEIVIVDSIFVVGQKPNMILRQIPKPGSKVKEDRKIYVTVTKGQADQIAFGKLPDLYGKGYEEKKRELEEDYRINCRIVGYIYDGGGPPNHILEVIYAGVTVDNGDIKANETNIEIGGTLDFILSRAEGGELPIPDLICKRYSEAEFFTQTINMKLEPIADSDVKNMEDAFIYDQQPKFEPAAKISMGETIKVFLKKERPIECGGGRPKPVESTAPKDTVN
ncbi:MAG: PASTA domain-containing protein [Saprospiraceae bacterium]